MLRKDVGGLHASLERMIQNKQTAIEPTKSPTQSKSAGLNRLYTLSLLQDSSFIRLPGQHLSLPMAEAVFAQLVREAHLQDSIEVDSAGTADWDIDSAPHPVTLYILEQNGINYSGEGRKLLKADLDTFDYIITMDDENLRDVKKLGPGSATVAPLMSFVEGTDIREIPDPYFDNGFEIVYMLVQAGTQGLLQHIKAKHRFS